MARAFSPPPPRLPPLLFGGDVGELGFLLGRKKCRFDDSVSVLRPSDDALVDACLEVDLGSLGFLIALPYSHGYTMSSL